MRLLHSAWFAVPAHMVVAQNQRELQRIRCPLLASKGLHAGPYARTDTHAYIHMNLKNEKKNLKKESEMPIGFANFKRLMAGD